MTATIYVQPNNDTFTAYLSARGDGTLPAYGFERKTEAEAVSAIRREYSGLPENTPVVRLNFDGSIPS